MLLDSNIIIYALDPAYLHVADFLAGKSFKASSITKLEVLGYHRLSQTDFDRFRIIFNTMDILPVSREIIEYAINLRRSRSIGLADAIIAATCLVHHLSLVTHNVRDFSWIGKISIIDPLSGVRD